MIIEHINRYIHEQIRKGVDEERYKAYIEARIDNISRDLDGRMIRIENRMNQLESRIERLEGGKGATPAGQVCICDPLDTRKMD